MKKKVESTLKDVLDKVYPDTMLIEIHAASGRFIGLFTYFYTSTQLKKRFFNILNGNEVKFHWDLKTRVEVENNSILIENVRVKFFSGKQISLENVKLLEF